MGHTSTQLTEEQHGRESGTFTNLAPATYNVQIRDAANTWCVVILNAALAITQPAVLSATVGQTNVTCFGGSDGTITISAPAGGYGTYEYSINGGGSWQASGNFTALVPGNYNVQIRDAAHTGCVIVLNASLPITQPAALTAVVTPTNVTCNGANDGIINITAPTGGSGTYEYSNNGGTTWQASGLFNGLIPATYNVQIRDAANPACLIVLNSSLTITEPAVLNAVVASTDITCNGANDGTISVTSPTGGYGTFDYSDNGGATWQASGNFINLTPGTYNVQIRDKAHTACVMILNPALVITQPVALSATLASTNVTCFGANNGTITITNPLGGYGTYSYSVNGGATWQPTGTFTNLSPSTYVVEIRDAAHIACVATLNAALIITQPPVLSAAVTSTNVTCNGTADGTITIEQYVGNVTFYCPLFFVVMSSTRRYVYAGQPFGPVLAALRSPDWTRRHGCCGPGGPGGVAASCTVGACPVRRCTTAFIRVTLKPDWCGATRLPARLANSSAGTAA